MARIFLSYARRDASAASALAKALQDRGHDVWWDQHIGSGRRFAAEIERALEQCQAVVVLWSKASRDSAWVQDEAAVGRDSGRLVPVSLDESPPPIGFRQFQTIDFSSAESAKLDEVVDAIGRAAAELAGEKRPETASRVRSPSTPRLRPMIATAILAAILAVAAAVYLALPVAAGPPSVQVVAGRAGDPGLTSEVARILTNDLQRLQYSRAERFSLLAGDPAKSDFQIEVAGTTVGDQLQVDINLKSSPEILWSGAIEVPAQQRSNIRQQVVAKVGAVLNCALDAHSPDGKRADAATLKLFLRACDAVNFDRSTGAPDRVVATLEQVVRRNPKVPAAWALLAHAQFFAGRDTEQVRKSNDRARALDPANALAFYNETLLLPPGSWAKALAIADEAAAAAPNDSMVHVLRSEALANVGRISEAINEARLAVQLDPISLDNRLGYVSTLAMGGRREQALSQLEEAERTWPGAAAVRLGRFGFHLRYGDPRTGRRLMDEAGWTELTAFSPLFESEAAQRAFLVARENPSEANVTAALAAYRAMSGDEAEKSASLLQALVTLGRLDEAVAMLNRPEIVNRWKAESGFLFAANIAPLRKRPEFLEFTRRFGLLDVWRSTGKWPDFCREPGLPYDCRRG